jgi:demethylmenaquinone methyltransferase/2-methoxy-6-polyprenyl-1,4-benzoquinol methylase
MESQVDKEKLNQDSIAQNGKSEADKLLESKSNAKIQQMFDEVAPTYDMLNHVLSFGIDYYWRNNAKKYAQNALTTVQTPEILDVATGTGDLAKALKEIQNAQVTGLDLSEEMLAIARTKCPDIEFLSGKAESLPFKNESFHIVSAGFGVRNFQDLPKGMSEFHRVLKPGGHAIIIEPMIPRNTLIKGLYQIYFQHVLPKFAKLFTKSSFAYDYLPKSVASFPQCEDFLTILLEAGFEDAQFIPMTFETAIMYVARK